MKTFAEEKEFVLKMFEFMDSGWKWIGVDLDGSVYAYEQEGRPATSESVHNVEGSGTSVECLYLLNFPALTADWENALFERPLKWEIGDPILVRDSEDGYWQGGKVGELEDGDFPVVSGYTWNYYAKFDIEKMGTV